jgi:hypothetical protein
MGQEHLPRKFKFRNKTHWKIEIFIDKNMLIFC